MAVVIFWGLGRYFPPGMIWSNWKSRDHPTRNVNGGSRQGAERADVAGVALLLREYVEDGATFEKVTIAQVQGPVFKQPV